MSFVSSTVVWSLTAPVTIPFVDSSSNSTKLDSVVTWPPPLGLYPLHIQQHQRDVLIFMCRFFKIHMNQECSSVSIIPSA